MMGANLVALVPLNAMARDIMPRDRVGVFSGVRMFFLRPSTDGCRTIYWFNDY